MAAFFVLSALAGITIIISKDLSDTNTVGAVWVVVS